MKKMEFKINIAADRQKVWNTMLQPATYKKWVDVSWPGAYYQGKWEEGENMRFLSPGGGGTVANIAECRPYEYILAKHIAVINSDGTEDRDSSVAKGWIGSTEAYTLTEKNGKTELKIEVRTSPEWEDMFRDGWPNALSKLKEISEK